MTVDQNIQEIEVKLKNKAYLSFHKDGLIDILMGWNLMGVGLFLYTHSIIFSWLGLLPLILYKPLKQRISLPRLGHASFRAKRTPTMWAMAGVGGVLLLAAVVSVFSSKNTLGGVGPIALVIVGLAFVMVLTSGFNRILAYALLVPLLFIVGLGLGFLSPAMTIVVGVVVMLSGIWMLVNFIRSNPILDAGEADVAE